MKELLVILGTVMLGVFIFINIILGDNEDSLKTGARNIAEKMRSDLVQSTSDTTNP
jgi:hypothetical protein